MPQKSKFCYESPTKAPSFVGAFVEKFYTKGGFRVDSRRNLKGFMPRKGYDRGTIKKCRTSVWCGFPSSNRVWRSNNPLRWSPVLQHRRPPLHVFHELGRSTSLLSLCTIQNVRKGVRKAPPFRTPFVPLLYPSEGTKGYQRPRKGLRKGTLSLIRLKAPLSYPFRGPTKGYEKGGAFVQCDRQKAGKNTW